MKPPRKRAARASCFRAGSNSVPFELGAFFVQEEAKRVFGAPASRVKGRVRDMRGTLSGGTAASAKATFDAVAKDLSLVAILKDAFALTPGFKGPKQPPGSKPLYEEDLQSWAAPFMMALINTRNVHRSNMLMGFPYGKEFVYDEMVLTGDGEKGEANAKLVMAANTEKTGPDAPKPGEGPSKEERENGLYDLLYVGIAADGKQVRASVKGDRDPGYGSTSKMISECAICLLRDSPDVPAGFWTPGAAMQHRLIKRLVDHAGSDVHGGEVARNPLESAQPYAAGRDGHAALGNLRGHHERGIGARLPAFGGGEHAPHGAQHHPEVAPMVDVDDEAFGYDAEERGEHRDAGLLPGRPDKHGAKAEHECDRDQRRIACAAEPAARHEGVEERVVGVFGERTLKLQRPDSERLVERQIAPSP